MPDPIPAELEERISFYENPANDPGGLDGADWTVLLLTGVLLPLVCLVLAGVVGWHS